ncbi:MAG: PilZ domain-containing protein [Gammaproteobacteria bacterium]|nr:PilZ domain-containing protein [Gammaproteobacteria bacterium]
MSINYEEKRDFIRMNTEHALQFREIGSNEIQQGVCRNLSATGIMFTAKQEIPRGTELAVTITPQYSMVSPMISPFDAIVRVVRTQTNGMSSQYTIAGKITSIQ